MFWLLVLRPGCLIQAPGGIEMPRLLLILEVRLRKKLGNLQVYTSSGGSHNLWGGKSGSHLWEGSPLSGRMYEEHRHLDPRQVRSGKLNMPPPLFMTAILGVWQGGMLGMGGWHLEVEERWQPHKLSSPSSQDRKCRLVWGILFQLF